MLLAGLSNLSRETNNWKGDGRQKGVTHSIIIRPPLGISQELVDENQEVVTTVKWPSMSQQLWQSQGDSQELRKGIFKCFE